MNKKIVNILKKISTAIGWIIMVAGFLLGLWVALYLMFYGGIVQIINGINPLDAIAIATGICKIVFCEVAVVIPILGMLIGSVFLDWGF